jgi:hypothetical protein
MNAVGQHIIVFGGRSGKNRIAELRVIDTEVRVRVLKARDT